MSKLRLEVLRQFKNLHKTRKLVFDGDAFALEQARQKINGEFKKSKHVGEKEAEELLKFAKEVEIELRTNVIQAVEKQPGVFQLRITEHTPLLDNVMFDEHAEIPSPRNKKCSDK